MFQQVKTAIFLPLLLLSGLAHAQSVVWAKKANEAFTNAKRLIVLQLDSTDLTARLRHCVCPGEHAGFGAGYG